MYRRIVQIFILRRHCGALVSLAGSLDLKMLEAHQKLGYHSKRAGTIAALEASTMMVAHEIEQCAFEPSTLETKE